MAWHCVGIPVAFLCLTGILLAYHGVLDRALNPHFYSTAEGEAPRVPLSALLSAVQSVCPKELQETTWIWIPSGRETPRAYCDAMVNTKRTQVEVFVDGADGKVLGTREYAGSVLGIIVNLHTNFLLGDIGKYLTSLLAGILLISAGTGLYLWWPRMGGLRERLAVRRPFEGPRFWRDLHRTTGAINFIILALVAITALRLQFPLVAEALLGLGEPVVSQYRLGDDLKLEASQGGPRPIDEIIEIARSKVSSAVLTDVWIPHDEKRPIKVALRQPYELNKDAGHTLFWINRFSGEIVLAFDPFQSRGAQWWLVLLETLHSGEAIGLVGTTLIEIAALSTVVLCITGYLVWRRKGKLSGRKTTLAAPPNPHDI